MDFSDRVTHLVREGAYEMLARAQALEAAGRDIIHLEIGQPDSPTFEPIVRAGVKALQEGHTRYGPPAGLPVLREAIALDAGRRRGVRFEPSQVVVGPGTKPGMFFPTLALVRPGDEVLYPDPGFPTYPAMIRVAGGLPVPVPVVESNDFAFDLEAFGRLISKRTRMIILNSPSNPTGGVLSLSALEHIAEAVQAYGCWVLSDEIYARLVYDGPNAPSIVQLAGMAERTVVCDGFSKTYAMTGWRLGFGIMPKPLAERVELLQTHIIGCPATFTQIAGLQALCGPQDRVEEVVREYDRRRRMLVEGLNAIPGIRCRMPQGAFYAFPNIKAFGRTSADLSDYLLEAAGVALLPGTDFGDYGEGYLRLCFANSVEAIQEALARIEEALGRLPLE